MDIGLVPGNTNVELLRTPGPDTLCPRPLVLPKAGTSLLRGAPQVVGDIAPPDNRLFFKGTAFATGEFALVVLGENKLLGDDWN